MDDESRELWTEFVKECKEWVAFVAAMDVEELCREDIDSLKDIEKAMAAHVELVMERRRKEAMRLAEEERKLEEGKSIEEQDEEVLEDNLSDLSLGESSDSGNSPFPPFEDAIAEFEVESQTAAEQGLAGAVMVGGHD
ncbi:hypothetical protein B7494_g2187 [Chlorociboria aeruginascens]|nr:hypothetical protein B7494_g2187 [Chlorociboria aeruginascens]